MPDAKIAWGGYGVLTVVLDAYNRTLKGDVCGTLTAAGGLAAMNCGSFLVMERKMEETKIKVVGEMDGFESANRVYDAGAKAPALRTYQGGGLQPKVLEKEPALLGGLGERKSNGGTQFYQQDRVFSSEVVAPAHPAQIPGGSYKFAVASRGRGEANEQRLEVNESGNSNALTTVQKDSLVLEQGCLDGWRIRKLTPRECYRLMGVKDSDVDKIQSVISKSQQYKTAGNSIVTSVLSALFLQMGIQGKKRWNDMTEEEREPLWNLRGK